MRRRAGRGRIGAGTLLALGLGLAPVAAQEPSPPPSRPAPTQQDAPRPAQASRPGNAGDLAGPELSAPAQTPPEGRAPARAPQAGAPFRVAPPPPANEGAVAALGRAVLTVDQEAMYRQSRWGLRAQAELAAQSRQVAADNDRAFADLVADEDALTAARATLSPDQFRARAAQFDEQVMAVRQEREAARMALAETAERDRALFFQAAAPVLGRVMTSRGALVVLDQRTVLIADDRIDVTAATIAALDAELRDGREIVAAAARAQARALDEAAKDNAPPAPDAAPAADGPAPIGETGPASGDGLGFDAGSRPEGTEPAGTDRP